MAEFIPSDDRRNYSKRQTGEFNNEEEVHIEKEKKIVKNIEDKILIFDKSEPYFTVETDPQSLIFPMSAFVRNLNTVSRQLFYVFNSNYGLRTHSSFEKYLDCVAGYALKKLLFRKSDFSKIQEEEIKSIVQDIIE
eukprot:CAMPEP_0170521476 /NCGR_PEP_ID=MMETSP0209-20121228/6832_1 /TAXON_ID=665100 ORGANISM="Litonotus pictus, Strain P1" /NCGR_SAMPLE_ID=MMETSP0209 /ASSEMBLY_ACC=CAM_ASM_000301 /LENGTH=135 /DNA_ID=CAMNT_0010808363 /DNA_START=614 /DNA_END=1018 /DNA_ORIENTATION=+